MTLFKKHFSRKTSSFITHFDKKEKRLSLAASIIAFGSQIFFWAGAQYLTDKQKKNQSTPTKKIK